MTEGDCVIWTKEYERFDYYILNVADKYLVIKYMSRLNLYYLMSNFLTSHEWCNSTCER